MKIFRFLLRSKLSFFYSLSVLIFILIYSFPLFEAFSQSKSNSLHHSPNPPPPNITPTSPTGENQPMSGAIQERSSSSKDEHFIPAKKKKKIGIPPTLRVWPPNNSSYESD